MCGTELTFRRLLMFIDLPKPCQEYLGTRRGDDKKMASASRPTDCAEVGQRTSFALTEVIQHD